MFFLVFSFLIYNPFFLILFLLEVSPLSLYVPSSSVVWFLLSLTGIFLLLPVLTPHLGAEGRDPQILGRGVAGRVAQGGSQGGRRSRGRVVKYYYILSCTGSMFESGYF